MTMTITTELRVRITAKIIDISLRTLCNISLTDHMQPLLAHETTCWMYIYRQTYANACFIDHRSIGAQ